MKTFASGDLMSKSRRTPSWYPEPRLQVKPSMSFPALVQLSRCRKAFSLLLLSSSVTRRGETPVSHHAAAYPRPPAPSPLPLAVCCRLNPTPEWFLINHTAWRQQPVDVLHWPAASGRSWQRMETPASTKTGGCKRKKRTFGLLWRVSLNSTLVWREVSVEQLCRMLCWLQKKIYFLAYFEWQISFLNVLVLIHESCSSSHHPGCWVDAALNRNPETEFMAGWWVPGDIDQQGLRPNLLSVPLRPAGAVCNVTGFTTVLSRPWKVLEQTFIFVCLFVFCDILFFVFFRAKQSHQRWTELSLTSVGSFDALPPNQ